MVSHALCRQFGAIDDKVETLPTFDIEYMFLRIRSKSVGETVELIITCQDDGETKVPVNINLEDINVVKTEGHDTTIMITDKIGLTMRYPTMKQLMSYDMSKITTMEGTFKVINDCLENVFDENEVYEEMNSKELQEFIEQMTTEQFQKVSEFFHFELNSLLSLGFLIDGIFSVCPKLHNMKINMSK